jgi:NADH:ubiquinone oxidoreductase subunit E
VHDLSLYLLEVLENSVRAGATHLDVALFVDQGTDTLRLTVDDDGSGLSATPEQTLDPFYTTKSGKKTGLGLSLLQAEAQAAGGDLVIGPSPALGGVRVKTFMRLNHVDRPPLGDVATTIIVTAATNPDIEFTISLEGDQFTPPLEHAPPKEAAERLASHRPAERSAGPPTMESTDKGVVDMPDKDMTNGSSCQCCSEEVSEEELLGRLDEVIRRYKDKPGALIPVLQQAQGICGYLPEFALKHIARQMKKPYSEVAGVVSFYSFFSTVPRGKHIIRVCLGTACYVRGGLQVLDAVREKLGIDVGETTEDRMFSLEVARCFGACGLAPAVSIDEDVHRRVRAARVGQMLAPYYTQEEVIENVAS